MALDHMQIMAAARIMAVEKFPYFSDVIYSLMPCPREGVLAMLSELGTPAAMAVSASCKLYYDPEVIENEWSVEDVEFGILHEAGHILRDHHGMCASTGFDKRVFNTAGDAVINQSLVDAGLKALDTDVLPHRIKDDDGKPMEAGQLEMVYYLQLLKNQCQKCGAKLSPGKKKKEDEEGEGKEGKEKKEDGEDKEGEDKEGEGKEGEGEDKEGEGKEGEGEGKEGEGEGPKCSACGTTGKPKPSRRTGGNCGSGAGNSLDALEGDDAKGEPGGRSSIDVDRIRKAVAQAIQNHEKTKGRGSVSGSWSVWADQELEAPKVRWQDRVARITRGAVSQARGRVDYTYCRPSRRQAGIGFGLNKPVLPSMTKVVPIVGFFIDTSGSMNQDDLRLGVQEVVGILKSTTCEMFFGACDAQIAEEGIRKVGNIAEVLRMLKGGGGTDFRPVFEVVAAMPASIRPQILIFATDGCGPAPIEPPPGITVIWLLVGENACVPYKGDSSGDHIDWGEKIYVTDQGACVSGE